MKTADIRRTFLEAFAERGHRVLPSAPLVPQHDPTLFFVNAGMVPFKDHFTGQVPPPAPRVATVQKCLRVSGKHNDLENVGRTPRHHTFFEMLGNFSFGDYFKAEAIRWAWEILTGPLGLDPERLWVTVFREDDEAWAIWTRDIGIAPGRVQRLGEKDNFWSMGDVGPCGPCSEIHWDRGPRFGSAEDGPAGGGDRYMELWNLVFMQFEQHPDGSRTPLPRPSIDTGMGLERLAMVLGGLDSTYDTDVLRALVEQAAEMSGRPYGGSSSTAEQDVAMRVIADHARATAFLVADGVTPSNEDRGYVLRRIMRRAIRFGFKLGLRSPFFHRSTARVVELMGDAWPELVERAGFVEEVVLAEEERFAETLERGLHLLDEAFGRLSPGAPLPGEVAFQLHDTYGFPLDLTALIARERGVEVDQAGFERAMERQRAAGRAAWRGSGQRRSLAAATDAPPTTFLGYETLEVTAPVLAVLVDGEPVTAAEAGQEAALVLEATPFYAEAGGQVGDRGAVEAPGGRFEVLDVQKDAEGHHLHLGRVTGGAIAVGDHVRLVVDAAHREATRRNHTATHLLHAALRRVLGEHVIQKGSLVAPDRLRFDFSHHRPVSEQELEAIEDLVYAQVLEDAPVRTEVTDLASARRRGAMALFGEKYGDRVRVVEVPGFSTELCGGTHVDRTGQIGLFRLVSEGGVAAGVRRVEALTGMGALTWTRARDVAARRAAGRLRSPVETLPEAVERALADRRRLEKERESLRRELARASASDLLDQAVEVDGIRVLAAEIQGDVRLLREEAERLRDRMGSGVVVLGSRTPEKVVLVATASRDLAGARVHAGRLVGAVARMVGGGGGGRPDMAQAGGRQPDRLPEALASVPGLVAGEGA